jgi:hypothetical protein
VQRFLFKRDDVVADDAGTPTVAAVRALENRGRNGRN